MVNIKILSYLPSIDVIICKKIRHVHELFGQPSYIFSVDFFLYIDSFSRKDTTTEKTRYTKVEDHLYVLHSTVLCSVKYIEKNFIRDVLLD
jgi:hypothetical protein